MCGIAGIVSFDPTEVVDEARVKRMRDVLRHRGPDGEGLVVDGPVGLGHRRLAIVDLAGGAQPMATADRSAWIVYNGEVYNHPDLRAALEARGHRYRTRSDTETILHLYEDEGERCVGRLNGMFAFALWDARRRRLLLARDRLGIKPLYYTVTDRELLFASEIKGLLAANAVRPALDTTALPEFLATRTVAGASTLFRGIRKLPPGHVLTWSARDGIAVRRYWTLPGVTADDRRFTEAARDVRERLEASVRRQLMSDVPLGVFLSGGIDSSAITAIAAAAVDEPLHTFSVGFDEPEGDELGWARLAADSVGARHHEVRMTADEFFRLLPQLVWHQDEPIAFSAAVPLYVVSRLAREHVKVVLTGEGADELFLGYNRYRITAANAYLGVAYRAVVPAPLRGLAAAALRATPRGARRYVERSFMATGDGPRRLVFDNFAVFGEAALARLLADPAPLTTRGPHAAALAHWAAARGGVLQRMSHVDVQTYLVELLMKQDRMSMAASVESRVPFLDHTLVEHVAAMPVSFRLRGWRTKAVLRAALEGLVPREILWRRKMGFPVPVGRWLRGRFERLARELVVTPAARRGLFVPAAVERLVSEHRAGVADHGERLWLLANLELWQRIFVDGEDPASLREAMHG